jgi:hypothetical protein
MVILALSLETMSKNINPYGHAGSYSFLYPGTSSGLCNTINLYTLVQHQLNKKPPTADFFLINVYAFNYFQDHTILRILSSMISKRIFNNNNYCNLIL